MNISLIWVMHRSMGQGPGHASSEILGILGLETSVSESTHLITRFLHFQDSLAERATFSSSCSLLIMDNLFGCCFLLMHSSEVFVEFRRKASLNHLGLGLLSPRSLVERRVQLFPVVVCEKLAWYIWVPAMTK